MKYCVKLLYGLVLSNLFLLPFDHVLAQSILGEIKVDDTSNFPNNVVCQLEVQRKGIKTLWLWKGKHQSTGFFITPNTVMTNAHNVYSNIFTRVTDININPGRNSELIILEPPVVTGRKKVKSTVRIPQEYSFYQGSGKRVKYDYAIILLPNYSTQTNNSFELAEADSLVAINDKLTILGYPGETRSGEEQYLAEGKLISINDKTIEYNISTETGNSGSPVYVFANGKYYVIGVHAFHNQATKVNSDVIARLKAWIESSQIPN